MSEGLKVLYRSLCVIHVWLLSSVGLLYPIPSRACSRPPPTGSVRGKAISVGVWIEHRQKDEPSCLNRSLESENSLAETMQNTANHKSQLLN